MYLRGALHQSFYPDGVYTAGDASVLRNDIAHAKKCGFDFLRIHIKIDDPLLLHYADTMGILLMLDFPNFGEGGDTPKGRRRFEDMMRRAIERDFNHPAVIAWCVFNETWGFGGQVELVKLFGPEDPAGGTAERPEKARQPGCPGMGPADVGTGETPRSHPARRRHERGLLGAPGLLRARGYGHQFVAFLRQRLPAGARAHRESRQLDLRRLDVQLRGRLLRRSSSRSSRANTAASARWTATATLAGASSS